MINSEPNVYLSAHQSNSLQYNDVDPLHILSAGAISRDHTAEEHGQDMQENPMNRESQSRE